jgi:hypothetical protein
MGSNTSMGITDKSMSLFSEPCSQNVLNSVIASHRYVYCGSRFHLLMIQKLLSLAKI